MQTSFADPTGKRGKQGRISAAFLFSRLQFYPLSRSSLFLFYSYLWRNPNLFGHLQLSNLISLSFPCLEKEKLCRNLLPQHSEEAVHWRGCVTRWFRPRLRLDRWKKNVYTYFQKGKIKRCYFFFFHSFLYRLVVRANGKTSRAEKNETAKRKTE